MASTQCIIKSSKAGASSNEIDDFDTFSVFSADDILFIQD